MSVRIEKSEGVNDSEKFPAHLCEKTFLKMWSYPNTFKSKGDELCDLIAIFENHVFIFCDKAIKFNTEKDVLLAWDRWKREAIEKQIYQVRKAKKHLLSNPNEVYLDAKCTQALPIKISSNDVIFHQIIVANGAKDACKSFSEDNANGSLGICYGDDDGLKGTSIPFLLFMDKKDPIHVFDEHIPNKLSILPLKRFPDIR